jgi:hypothetical protein
MCFLYYVFSLIDERMGLTYPGHDDTLDDSNPMYRTNRDQQEPQDQWQQALLPL